MNKIIRWSMLAVLGLCSPAALALGLGGAVVESYLDQPLDVRIDLISQNEAELQSITAGLASAEDFEMLGMSIAAITVPLEFVVVTDADRPYIHVTSRLKVNEPVVQVLVEVVWASGRMLREYTLFLDPPTIDSQAPPATVRPAPVKPAVAEASDSPVTPIQKKATSGRETAQSSATESATASTEGQQQTPAGQAGDDEVYGPVASGETLWGIAREYSRGSGYTINQTMLALQRKNPKAFINGNINALKRGAILRMPAFNEIAELTSREALLEVLRQEEEARSGVRSVAPDLTTPTVAESGDYQSSAVAEEPGPVPEEDAGHLELVPPAETEAPDTQGDESIGESNSAMDTPAVESLQEELSRTEEELLNARQENSYLTERIRELEAEAAAREEQALAVTDPDLAKLESRLAEERESGQAEPPVAITPGGEEQAWYAGKTPLLLGVAVVLIGLLAWALRRWGAVVPAALDEAEALADAGDNTRTAVGAGDEAATVVQTAPEAVAEPEPITATVVSGEPEREIEPALPVEPITDEPQPFAELQEAEGPTVVLRQPGAGADIEAEAGAEPDFETFEEASDLEFEDDAEEEPVQSEDDPEIKLDLARAYLSLGDKEASRSMLDEVLKSGSESQKAEARQMLEEF